MARLTWAFVGLGVVLRLARFLLRHPLWGDEAFIAVNLIDRGYLDLLRPLDHGQVSPLLFLWIERAMVDWLGFNELSLRLFPTACGIAGVVLFRHVAGRVVQGVPLLLAVAIFSVSFYPIRHGGEVKPYASDLLTTLLLLAPAIEWWRGRDDRWLWALAAVVPVALGLSHPAVFVAGGISLGLAPAVWRARRRRARAAYVTLNAAIVGTFVFLFLVFTGPQGASIARDAPNMRVYWASGFPPRNSALAVWLIRAHTGNLFAYPAGGDRGGSVLTALAVAMAAIDLARRREGTLLAICLAPFGVALVAAGLERYPYGSSTRVMLYLAPNVCLLAGMGAAGLLSRIRPPRNGQRAIAALVAVLFLFGATELAIDFARPYRSAHDLRSRAFARRFWVGQSRDAELVCLRSDLGLAYQPVHWRLIRTPLYLCNQAISFARRRAGRPPDWDRVSASRPLRFVLFDEHPLGKTSTEAWAELPCRDPALAVWLKDMQARYVLRSRKTYVVNEGICEGMIWFEDRYVVFEFAPALEPEKTGIRGVTP